MRRLLLFGLFLALPLAAVPIVGAAAGGGGGGPRPGFRDVRPATHPQPSVVALSATPTRVSFVVTRAGGVEVAIRDADGRLVQRLGHFTVAARQRLILSWRGAEAPSGSVAVVTVGGDGFRVPVRRLARADDADRQSLREPGHSRPR
jgi:hypothetical protein